MNMKRRFSLSVFIGLVLISILACSTQSSGEKKPVDQAANPPQAAITATRVRTATFTPLPLQATKPRLTGTVTVLPPTATTRPKTKDLEVMPDKTWFSNYPDDDKQVGYVVNINNPDEEYQLEDVSYKITVIDNAGKELGAANERIMLLMPGEHKPLAGRITIPAGSKPAQIKADVISPGRPTLTKDKKDPIEASNLWYLVGGAPPASSETAPRWVSFSAKPASAASDKPVLTAVVTSSYDQDIYYANYAVAAYDDKGAIVGGGFSFGEVLPSHSSIGVEVPLVLTGKPATFELSFTGASSTLKTPPVPIKLEVASMGLVRKPDRTDAAVVFMLKNTDPKTPVAKFAYIATVFNGDGKVLVVCHNTFYGVIFPGQQLPIGCTLQIPPKAEGVRAELVTLVDTSNTLPDTVSQNPLSVSEVTFEDLKANAVIKSTWASGLKDVLAQLVVYDATGALIGYGTYPSLKVPANGEAPVEIWYSQVQGKPARVEIYAVPSQFSFEN